MPVGPKGSILLWALLACTGCFRTTGLCASDEMCPADSLCGVDGRCQPACPSGTIWVKGGTYTMGSSDTNLVASSYERPAHQVTVKAFCMDQTEVTVSAYRACRLGGACADDPGSTATCNWGQLNREKHPVNCVSSIQASAYCAAQGKILPTEEEWEYAARGAQGSMYPWGEETPTTQLCWQRMNIPCDGGLCFLGTCEVMLYPLTLFGQTVSQGQPGLADLAGNVWEWTSTKYCDDYAGNGCTTDNVLRGGTWYDGPEAPYLYRASFRGNRKAPGFQGGNIGFRCIKHI